MKICTNDHLKKRAGRTPFSAPTTQLYETVGSYELLTPEHLEHLVSRSAFLKLPKSARFSESVCTALPVRIRPLTVRGRFIYNDPAIPENSASYVLQVMVVLYSASYVLRVIAFTVFI